jgi:hypothetical protein
MSDRAADHPPENNPMPVCETHVSDLDRTIDCLEKHKVWFGKEPGPNNEWQASFEEYAATLPEHNYWVEGERLIAQLHDFMQERAMA